MDESRIILAADGLSIERCTELVAGIGSRLYAVKVHDVLEDGNAHEVLHALRDAGAPRIWADMKLHDIPTTNVGRAKRYQKLGVEIVTAHIDSGMEAMMAMVDIGIECFGVSVLTSIDGPECELLTGHTRSASVLYRAQMAKLAGLRYMVCSPLEVSYLAKRRELQGLGFIVPGTRKPGAEVHDQKNVDTMTSVLQASPNSHVCFVVGRQLTGASDPVDAMDEIEAEIEAALKGVA